jgi:hypothetical protein
LGVIQRSSASRMSCSNNAPRPRSETARPPRPFGVTKPNVRSLPAISIGIGGGPCFASVAACILRSQSKSSGVRFGLVALMALILSNSLGFAKQHVDRPGADLRIPPGYNRLGFGGGFPIRLRTEGRYLVCSQWVLSLSPDGHRTDATVFDPHPGTRFLGSRDDCSRSRDARWRSLLRVGTIKAAMALSRRMRLRTAMDIRR